VSGRAFVSAVIALALGTALVLAPPTGVRPVAATSGPVAEWTFDDGSGTTATDAIGNLDGTITGGATWITEDVAQGTGALAFDGIDDLVTVANHATLEPSGAFTIALWVKAEYDTSFGSMVAKGHFDCGYGGSWGLVKTNTNPSGYARLLTQGGWHATGTSGPGNNWWDNKWHLLTHTVNPSTGSSTMTMDGHSWTSDWLGPDSVDYSSPDLIDSVLRFGGIDDVCIDYFGGSLDDIRLWDRALSQEEVLALLGDVPTTTELVICATCTGTSVTSAFVDEELNFIVRVSPWPASPGDITWYASKDGGPEEAFATAPLRIEDTNGLGWYIAEPGELSTGSYEIRAEWPGADNWLASTSATLPLEILARPVTMEASFSPTSVLPGESATVTARLSVDDPPDTYVISGSVAVYETTGESEVLVGSGNLAYAANPHWNTATINVPSISAGTHTYEARFPGTSTLAAETVELSMTAGKQETWSDLDFIPNPIFHTQQPVARVALGNFRLDAEPDLPDPTGTLTIKAYPGGAVITSAVATTWGHQEVLLPLQQPGTYSFTVTYSGDVNFQATTSEPESLTVKTDTVKVEDVGVEYTTFYPYNDGYRDTVAIGGTRIENATVAISIYNPDGKRIKTVDIELNAGAWSWAWNGRKASGEMYAAGKYKVVQVITDEANLEKKVTNYVTLSHKRIVMKTATLTKDHTEVAKKTQSWLAWNFKLPEAAVYTKLVFSIYGRDNFGGGGFGGHDYTECGGGTIHPDCVTRWRTFPTSFKWKSVTGNVTEDRSGRSVRLYAWGGFGDTRISKGRVTVTYGVLR
jgi:hypothetical protein